MANGTYGTPMTMGMTAGMGSQPMTTTGLQAGVVRNMNLPLSRATPIQVTETTPNLEEIQGFPVAGRGLDGTHFHQDPVSGQMYVMTEEFHQRIPQILSERNSIFVNISNTNTENLSTITSDIEENIGVINLNQITDYISFVDNAEQYFTVKPSSTYVKTNQFNGIINDTISFIDIIPSKITDISLIDRSKPINKFFNINLTQYETINLQKYIPINKYNNILNDTQYFGFGTEKYYTPINKFKN